MNFKLIINTSKYDLKIYNMNLKPIFNIYKKNIKNHLNFKTIDLLNSCAINKRLNLFKFLSNILKHLWILQCKKCICDQ